MEQKTPATAAVVVLALIAAFFMAPTAAEHVPLVNVALGDAHYSDFNADNGSWLASPVPPPPPPEPRPDPVSDWEWGAPTSGPGGAASGNNSWATNLAGNYNARTCAGLMSPPIDLSNATTASVSFEHWIHTDQSSFSGTLWDGGILMVTSDGGDTFSVVDPDQGYTDSLGSDARSCFDGQSFGTQGFGGPTGSTPPTPSYSTVSADLSAFAGETVQFIMAFSSNCCTHRAGWYVDDFGVTVDGTTTVEDFESSDGGFSIVGTAAPPPPPPQPLGWEWGEPTTGPAVAEGDSLWATQLHGDYGGNECSWVESPPIDLRGLADTGLPATQATLSWQQWYRSSSFSAGGVVQVSANGMNYTNVVPTSGYTGDPSGSGLDDCLEHRAQGTGAFSGFDSSVGSPLVDYEADLSEWLGETITVRFLFAVTDTTVNYEGWYVDNVAVSLSAYVGTPHTPDPPGTGGSDAPFWSSGGAESSWGYGEVTHDDTDAPTGEIAYGTNLDGSHNTGECSWIESPAVPGAVVAGDPTLTFDHWYRVAFAFSSTTATGGVVLISTDGGVSWSYLDSDDYVRPTNPSYPSLRNCLDTHGVDMDSDVFTGVKTEWDQVSIDLSDHVGPTTPSVQVRFLFGSHTSLAYEGWFIRSVELGGVSVL